MLPVLIGPDGGMLRRECPYLTSALVPAPNAKVEQGNSSVAELSGRLPTDSRIRQMLIGLVFVLTATVAGSAWAAGHFHQEAAQLSDREARQVLAQPLGVGSASRPSPSAIVAVSGSESPLLSSYSYELATSGNLRATVYLTTVSTDGGDSTSGQLIVSGLVRGGQAGVTYQLTGGDCDVDPPLDIVWAQGVADANGTALMTGQSRTLPKEDHYTLALGASPEPSGGGPGPGIEGVFVLGQASRYVAQACS